MQRRAILERDLQTHDKLVPAEADPAPNGGPTRDYLEQSPANVSSPHLPVCHPQSLYRPSLPVETLPLRARHSETECLCMVCGAEMDNIFGSEECWGKHKIVKATQIPIYKCSQCGFETTEIDAVVEFLSQALNKMLETGDRATARTLRQELKDGLKHQKLFNTSTVR